MMASLALTQAQRERTMDEEIEAPSDSLEALVEDDADENLGDAMSQKCWTPHGSAICQS